MLLRILAALARRSILKTSTTPFFRVPTPDKPIEQLVAEGLALQKAGEINSAESVYRKILAHTPNEPDALHLLATIQHGRGRMDQAEELVRRALGVSNRSVEYMNTLGTILGDTGRPEEAFHIFGDALKLDPYASLPRSNYLFLLNLLPDISRGAIFGEHVEWARIHAESLKPSVVPIDIGNAEQNELRFPIRIGYLSGDLWGGHPVGRICSTVLPRHDKRRFSVFYYNNTRSSDEVTSTLRSSAESWTDVRRINDESLAQRIRADKIDVLVDLSGHTRNNRLLVFARKPAKLQVTWLGYLNTTGMSAMDWRVASVDAEPPGAEKYHTERLWRLPGLPWPWIPPDEKRSRSETLERAEMDGPVVFGSFNAFQKLNSAVLSTWASILREVPNSRLRLYGVPQGSCIDRTYDHFERAHIEPSRVSMYGTVEYSQYMNAYSEVDISLDPFPYNGGATTCESLWMGVPVVSLAGAGGFGRTTACFLQHLGMNDLIALTLEGYRETAVRLAMDKTNPYRQRKLMRDKVRAKLSDSPASFIRELENAYLGMLTELSSRAASTC